LVLKEGANRRRKNLPTTQEVIIVILNEYTDKTYREVIVIERAVNGTVYAWYKIHFQYATYLPLVYLLLFPRGDRGFNITVLKRDFQNHSRFRKTVK